MSEEGLSSGLAYLVDGAKCYFKETFQSPPVFENQPVHSDLNWIPSLRLKIHDHLVVLCEASETPYPLVFSMRRLDVGKLPMPISIYCVCPEEVYLKEQADAKRLMNDGYGLLTVDSSGKVQRRSACIPLIQQITDEEFRSDIKGLPRKLRSRLAESFERYKQSAPSGSSDIAEVMEGLILRAGRDAVGKRWLPQGAVVAGQNAATLEAMRQAPQFKNAAAAIGAAQGYVSMYRNPSHHFPKDRAAAAKKYRDCRHGYLEGLKKVVFVRKTFGDLGLSGGL